MEHDQDQRAHLRSIAGPELSLRSVVVVETMGPWCEKTKVFQLANENP